MAHKAVFATLHYIYNLRMDAISQSVTLHLLEMIVRDQHSSLLEPISSWKEKDALLICPLELFS